MVMHGWEKDRDVVKSRVFLNTYSKTWCSCTFKNLLWKVDIDRKLVTTSLMVVREQLSPDMVGLVRWSLLLISHKSWSNKVWLESIYSLVQPQQGLGPDNPSVRKKCYTFFMLKTWSRWVSGSIGWNVWNYTYSGGFLVVHTFLLIHLSEGFRGWLYLLQSSLWSLKKSFFEKNMYSNIWIRRYFENGVSWSSNVSKTQSRACFW